MKMKNQSVFLRVILFAAWWGVSGVSDGLSSKAVTESGFVSLPCMLVLCCAWAATGAKLPLHKDASTIKAGTCVGFGLAALFWGVRLGSLVTVYAVKTSEPLYTTGVAIYLGEGASVKQALAVAVICGCSASLSVSVTFLSPIFAFASLSNLLLSCRTVFVKSILTSTGAAPLQLFSSISFFGFLSLVPLAAVEVITLPFPSLYTLALCIPSGICYFFYNYLGFLILESVSSCTYAVGKEIRCLIVYGWAALVWGVGLGDMRHLLGMAGILLGSVGYWKALKENTVKTQPDHEFV
eukprot:TRINITY_DN21983_c0_g1_i1.p1 TRINITY_DN21983_c0_g1~~TRINITY_DN21983_c0_g1_i1.p1  ORF type:complete len:295 (+),score=23.88 TRINITY_DN21983_c0_g1_i1:57-941(+)